MMRFNWIIAVIASSVVVTLSYYYLVSESYRTDPNMDRLCLAKVKELEHTLVDNDAQLLQKLQDITLAKDAEIDRLKQMLDAAPKDERQLHKELSEALKQRDDALAEARQLEEQVRFNNALQRKMDELLQQKDEQAEQLRILFSDMVNKTPVGGGEKELNLLNMQKAVQDMEKERQKYIYWMGLDPDEDLVYAVLTGRGYHAARANATCKYWACATKKHIFVSDAHIGNLPVLIYGDVQKQGAWKLFPTTFYFGRSESYYKDYKWLVVTDDTTFLNTSNLIKILVQLDPAQKIVIGSKDPLHGYRGMVLSKPAAEEIQKYEFDTDECHPFLNNYYKFLACLKEINEKKQAGIKIINDDRFGRIIHTKNNKEITMDLKDVKDAVSIHFLAPEEMAVVAGHSDAEPIKKPEYDPLKDLIVGVLTAQQFYTNRVVEVKSTWGRFIDHVFISDTNEPSVPTVFVNATGDYVVNKKVLGLVHHLGKEYLGKKKWFMIIDDDTFLCARAIRDLLTRYDPSQPFYIGDCVSAYRVYGDYNYANGGGGSLISEHLMRKFYDALERKECPPVWVGGDLWVGHCVTQKLNEICTFENGFHWGGVDINKFEQDPKLATYHYCVGRMASMEDEWLCPV